MQSKRIDSSDILFLPNDYLFKIFSLLPPSSLARCCLVCSSWNQIITNSSLWKQIYSQSKEHWLQLSSWTATTKGLNFLNDEVQSADWKSLYVKNQHTVLFVLGSVAIKEWKAHSRRVECCRLGMETLMTGSSDGVVCTWSLKTSKCLATFIVPNKGRVVDLEFYEDKILAVSGTEIYIWNRKKGSLLRRIQGYNQPLHSMCYADPEILVGCSDGTIRVFDIYSGRCARIFRQHSDRVTCIVVDMVACILMSGSADGTVKLCDLLTGEKICCLFTSAPPTEVLCLNHVLQQNTLIGGTSRGQVHAWDISKQKILWSVRIGPNSVHSLHSQFYDTALVVAGTINGVISILDTQSGVILRTFVIAHGRKQMTMDKKNSGESKGHLVVTGHSAMDIGSSVEDSTSNVPLPILCLKTGMTKIVTTHPDGMVRVSQFKLQ
ncbi:hypothetical protein KP509_07G048100 [Ceratopteris richardii]|uniref:F-box domain-containing protein n=1 Tax=Ceratopteris richardii TaxID=49495 RepID=A0A8T2UGS0_CERRI|nr:hypothetical protein KP509_07G048100 [Ceratopteris richardii]